MSAPNWCLALHWQDISNAAISKLGAAERVQPAPPAESAQARPLTECETISADVLIDHKIEASLKEPWAINCEPKE
jgi:hypothetical protein